MITTRIERFQAVAVLRRFQRTTTCTKPRMIEIGHDRYAGVHHDAQIEITYVTQLIGQGHKRFGVDLGSKASLASRGSNTPLGTSFGPFTYKTIPRHAQIPGSHRHFQSLPVLLDQLEARQIRSATRPKRAAGSRLSARSNTSHSTMTLVLVTAAMTMPCTAVVHITRSQGTSHRA